MSSKSVCNVTNGSIPVFFVAEYYSIVYTHHIFIHASLNGHVGCLHILLIINDAAVNMGVQVSHWDPVFIPLAKYPGVELLDQMEILFFLFWGTSILFSTVTARVYIPINSVGGSLLLTFLPALVILVLFRLIAFLCWNEAHAVSSSKLFILPTKKWVFREWCKFPKISQVGLHLLSMGELDNLVCFWGNTINLPCSGVGGLLVNNCLTPCKAMDTHLVTELHPGFPFSQSEAGSSTRGCIVHGLVRGLIFTNDD